MPGHVPYFTRMRRTPGHASIAAGRAGAVAWLAATATVMAAPPTYRVETLGTDLQGFAMNELGDVVGRQVSTQNVGRAFSTTELVRLVPIRLGDLNDDGYVDGIDLGMLLNAWGACAGTCPADLNDDGLVNGVDLGMMLGAWG